MAKGRRRRRAKGLGAFSLMQLQREIERRRKREIRELKSRRDELARAMARLDAEIARLGGAAPARKRVARKKATKKVARRRVSKAALAKLCDRVAEALKKSPKGLAISEIASLVKARLPRVRRAVKSLLAEKRIKKTGVRAATRYHAA